MEAADFTSQLAEVRTLDANEQYKEQLDALEAEYQFIRIRLHKEIRRANLPDRLHEIKELLCGNAVNLTYHNNLPFTGWKWDITICRQCKENSLKPRPFTNELCCENCGLLETLDGTAFDYNEIYKCGDYKVVKQRRSTRRYNFRHYLEKHLKLLSKKGHTLSWETIEKANEFFECIEEQLPKNISMPFVAYQILEHIVPEEKHFLKYFWLQVPQSSVAKHTEKWKHMLRQFDAQTK